MRKRRRRDTQRVLDELKKEGDSAAVQQAPDELPENVDHEQPAAVLMKLGIDPGSAVPGRAERS